MIKLLVFILFICILFSAGIVKALAFLGAVLILIPLGVLAMGAVFYVALVRNARRNML